MTSALAGGIIVTGSTGQVGTAVMERATATGVRAWGLARTEADGCNLLDRDAVARFVTERRPSAIIHAAALTDVDRCEVEPDAARVLNVDATAHLAAVAATVGAHLVYLSTNYVFDGEAAEPYDEEAETRPISVYGATKLAGEGAAGPDATIVRPAWIAGPHRPNLVRTVIARADAGAPLHFVDDQFGQATITTELAPALLHQAAERPGGTWHIANPGILTPFAWAQLILRTAGRDPDLVHLAGPDHPERSRPAPRPRNGAFDLHKWQTSDGPTMSDYPDALATLIDRLGLHR